MLGGIEGVAGYGGRDIVESLTKRIEEDSSSSDDETSNTPTEEPQQPDDLRLCMALEVAEEQSPSSWKQVSEANLTRRFVSAIEKEENNRHMDTITFYRGQIIVGNPCTIANLREFLSYMHANKTTKATKPTMKGLANASVCTYCGKAGHNEDKCWNKHPNIGRSRNNAKGLNPRLRECWECGKVGHV